MIDKRTPDRRAFLKVLGLASVVLAVCGLLNGCAVLSKIRMEPSAIEEMALIPAGEFLMGSPDGEGEYDEHPQHLVYLDAFYLDKHEVTNAQYKAFLDETRYDGSREADEDYLRHWVDGTYPLGKGDHPVVFVSWMNAKAYAKWAGKRLPTEAEWEYACRAGTTTAYNVGNKLDCDDANIHCSAGHGENPRNGDAPVGSYAPNAWGLYDMHGNVWEWCQDWYNEDSLGDKPMRNPRGPESGTFPVIRGGSWRYFSASARSANRAGTEDPPKGAGPSVGFRCARDIDSIRLSDDAADSLAGIEVVHEPDVVKAIEGGPSGDQYTWVFKTTVRSLVGPVTLKEFRAYCWENDTWIFCNYTGKPFTPEHFEEWYSCQNAILLSGEQYSDPKNWSGDDVLHRWKTKWVFIGVGSDGKEVRGEAIVELLSELIQ